MDLSVRQAPGSVGVLKQGFNLKKSHKDGLILQIHHTVPGNHGEKQRIRFMHATFDDNDDTLAASDHRANIFIVDLAGTKFWLLARVESCTAMSFSSYKKNELLIGTKNGSLSLINTETGKTTGYLHGHTAPINQISFSQMKYCLTASSEEAYIWDLVSNTQIHKLAIKSSLKVKQVLFMPVVNHILACFQDDTIHVWKMGIYGNFECFKQIVPDTWKSHHINSICFTRNGRAMVIGCQSQSLIVISLDDWSVVRVIELPNSIPGVKHIEFLPQQFDGGCNKILCVLSSQCALHFLNIETSTLLPASLSLQDGIRYFMCNKSGKYVAAILRSGEINVYASVSLLTNEIKTAGVKPIVEKTVVQTEEKSKHDFLRKDDSVHKRKDLPKKRLKEVYKQIHDKLDLQQLRPILREFGEYPESYRTLIWKTVLQLPSNKSAYAALVNRDCHPAYKNIENEYPLQNKSLLKHLKRLLSCLAHWCSLFGETRFLPLFVFPFVKIFQNDPVLCLEAIMTIIINWCQHWFEYFPFPPINILAMIENVLAQHDIDLMNWFYEHNITSQLYAWPLLEVSFSEVLSTSEWMKLWDHVLSNEPAFLLMAVVAYNITLRGALKTCQNIEDFEYFFHNQNPIDMKRFISKIYWLIEKTSDDVHPRNYLANFTPLSKDVYPVYNQYPIFIVDYQAQQMEQIRKEEENIIQESEIMQKMRYAQEKKLEQERRTEIHEARFRELEDVYRETVEQEEERIARKRQKVAALRHELRLRELELLEQARQKLLRKHAQQRQSALEHLVKDITRKKEREECEMMEVEDEMRWHYTNLLAHKQELERQLGSENFEIPDMQDLQQQRQQLTEELRKLREEALSGHHTRQIEIINRVAVVDELLKKVKTEIAKQLAEKQQSLSSVENTVKTVALDSQTKALEEEVENLLINLSTVKLGESVAKLKNMTTDQKEDKELTKEHTTVAEKLLQNMRHNNLHENREKMDQNVFKTLKDECIHYDRVDKRNNQVRIPSDSKRILEAVSSANAVREQLLSDSDLH